MSESNPRLMTLFAEALERSCPAERAAYLDRVCGGDAALRGRVEALLVAHAGAGRFLESDSATPEDPTHIAPGATAAFEPAPQPLTAMLTGAHDPGDATETFGSTPKSGHPSAIELGTVIAGRYNLIEVIGEGGMGSVFLASQSEPVKRQVALKLIKSGMDSKAVLARFDAERQALALMDHPNIARIYDGGVTPAGQPFFVMELVKGVPLTDYCDAKRLTVDARLQLFVSVCQAIQHAHQKGIIHRDLKPGNVLVTEVDGQPTPKVIDFGVAKATELKLTDMSFADVGTVVGTPAYMSPEQADPTSMDIDTRTDVYALGVMLYELLTGSPPIDSKQFKRGAILEMLRMIREVEPPRPSTRLSDANAGPNIAANRDIEPAKLAKLLHGELDWVVMKALEKDRTRRYDSANGLARDIQRYLADEVVEARPPSRGYRLKKFVKRNKVQVIAASLVLLALIGGIVGTSIGLVKAELARQAADLARDGEKAERERAQRLADDNATLAADESNAKQRAVEANEETARQLARVRAIMYTNQMAKAALLIEKQPTQALALLYDVDQCPIDLRDAAWNVAVQQCKRHLVSSTSIAAIGTNEIKTVSPNGTRLVSRTVRRDDGTGLSWVTLNVYEIPSGRLLATTPEFTDIPNSQAMRFCDDGSRLVLFVNHDYRFTPDKGPMSSGVLTVYLCDPATGKLTAVTEMKGEPHRPPVLAIRSALLAFAGPDNTAVMWDLAAGKQKHVLKGHTGSVSAFAFNADGTRIATGGSDNAIKVWDVQSGQLQFSQEMPKDNPDPEFQAYKQELERRPDRTLVSIDGVTALDFSLDGAVLAAGNRNWLLEIWDLKKGERRTTLRGTKAAIGTAHFYADGKTILVNGLNWWDIATGQQLLALPTGSMGFANADRRLLVSSGIRSVDVFDPTAKIAPRAHMVVEKLKSPIPVFAFCGKNGQFAAVACDDRVELWDTRTGTLRKPFIGHKNPIAALAVSPDGRILASSSRQIRPNVIKADPEPGPKKEPQHDDVYLWDVEKGERIGIVPVNEVEVPSLAFSPDGKTLATIRWRGGVRAPNVVVSVWDVATRQRRFDLEFNATEPLALGAAKVAFNPADGTLAAAAGNILRVWNLETRAFRELPSVSAGLSLVSSLRYSPDGKTLALGVGDGRGGGDVGFFNVRSGEPAGRLTGLGTNPLFTPDGKTIITQNRGKFHFWNPHTTQSLGSLDTGAYGFANIVLNPDGQTLGTVSADQVGGRVSVQLWDLTRPSEVVPLAGNISRFSLDSKTLMLTIGGSIQFLDLDTFRVRATVTTGRIGQGTDLSPDGRVLATTSGILSRFSAVPVELFDTRTGLKIREIMPHADDTQVRYAGVAFSPDGKHLAVASLPPFGEKPAPDLHITVAICQVADGKMATSIRVPFTDPNRNFSGGSARLAYSQDGTAILVSSSGGAATVIELTDPPRLVSLPSPKEVAGDPRLSVLAALRFTSDGKRIVGRYGIFPGKQPVVMWDRHTGRLVDGPIPDILPNPDNFVRISPDGRYEVRPNLLLTGRPSMLIDREVKLPVLVSPPSRP